MQPVFSPRRSNVKQPRLLVAFPLALQMRKIVVYPVALGAGLRRIARPAKILLPAGIDV